MPVHEYQCPRCGERQEKFYRSFQAAENDLVTCCVVHDADGLELDFEVCKRVPSVPLPAMLFGNPAGYHKPSALKRHSTKLIKEKGNG
jgi:hypothetical protein